MRAATARPPPRPFAVLSTRSSTLENIQYLRPRQASEWRLPCCACPVSVGAMLRHCEIFTGNSGSLCVSQCVVCVSPVVAGDDAGNLTRAGLAGFGRGRLVAPAVPMQPGAEGEGRWGQGQGRVGGELKNSAVYWARGGIHVQGGARTRGMPRCAGQCRPLPPDSGPRNRQSAGAPHGRLEQSMACVRSRGGGRGEAWTERRQRAKREGLGGEGVTCSRRIG